MSLLDTLEESLPPGLQKFDAFPKLPSSYKSRSSSGGVLSIVLIFLGFLLTLNDVGEYFYGWRDEEFGMDIGGVDGAGVIGSQGYKGNYMKINVDVVVGMPCRCMCLSSGYNV